MTIDLKKSNLALNGGRKIRTKPWKDNFTIGPEEKNAAMRVFDSGYLSLFEGSHTPDYPFSFEGGPEVESLEKEWSDYYEIKHSISMNSATSGLYAAIGALGIGFGDEVIVSPYTMTACAMAPMIYGAIPVFADIELQTGCLDPISIEKNITKNTKAILVVHQFGFPADMKRILKIAKKFNLFVIEDCAQAHGAKIDGDYVGTFGDIGVFSMNVNKTIQSGEGCICVTNDDEMCYRLQLIRNHGEAVVGPAGYENITNIAGFNYRLSELHAAVIREQLKKLDELNNTRLQLVKELASELDRFNFITLLGCRDADESTYYLFPFRYNQEITSISRENFINAVNAEGIQFYQGYTKPLYLQPVYQKKHLFKNGYPFAAEINQKCKMEYAEGLCPNAERLYFKEIVINEHIRHPHTTNDIKDIIISLKKVCGLIK